MKAIVKYKSNSKFESERLPIQVASVAGNCKNPIAIVTKLAPNKINKIMAVVIALSIKLSSSNIKVSLPLAFIKIKLPIMPSTADSLGVAKPK